MIGAVRKRSDFLFATNEDSTIEILKSRTVKDSKGKRRLHAGNICTDSQVLTGIVSILLGQLGMGKLMLLFPAPVTSGTSADVFAEAAKVQTFVSKDLCRRDR